MAPVFFCSALYVLLSQVYVEVYIQPVSLKSLLTSRLSINFIDSSISRFSPRLFYWIFIPCDIISLILQAVGGALSCVGENESDIDVGVDISLAGLIFQVVTLVIFCALFADYLLTCYKSSAKSRISNRMTFFLAFMFLSIFLILLRCVYRIVELHEGYFSELFRDEPLFIALESA